MEQTHVNDTHVGQVTVSFDLVEVDLTTGFNHVLPEFNIKVNDSLSWIPLSVSFIHRHSRKEFPFKESATSREDYLKLLKQEVICVRDA